MWGKITTRRFFYFCLVLLGAFLSFSSCSERKPLATAPEVESLPVDTLFRTNPVSDTLPIEGRILFGTRRCPSSMTLIMISEKTYPCINWRIENSFFQSGHHIRIELKGIFVPTICFTALGPATAAHQLNLLKGTYTLQFVHKRKFDLYRLTVTDSSIRIDPIRAVFTAPDPRVSCQFP